MGRPFPVELVKGAFGGFEEATGRAQLPLPIPVVVHLQRIRYYQPVLILSLGVIGQVVIIGIAVVDKAAVLRLQVPGIHAGAIAGIPA